MPDKRPQYQYLVTIAVDVKRTDGDHLTADENTMVIEMQAAAERIIAEIMATRGMNNAKRLDKTVRLY